MEGDESSGLTLGLTAGDAVDGDAVAGVDGVFAALRGDEDVAAVG